MGRARRRKEIRRVAPDATPAAATGRAANRLAAARSWLVGTLPILAIFFGARVALAEAYRIPSGSMEPTLLVGDWLWVNKLRYGPHVPFTNLSLPGYAEPRRGDVAVFVSPPQDPAIRISPDDVTPLLVKRIVGVAGDTLVMRHGVLAVNGVAEPTRNASAPPEDVAERPDSLFAWQHTIEVAGSRFGPPIAAPSLHEWGPLVVPAGHYFMMGDNRDNSVDSRYYGVVPRGNLRGRPTFVYYSYDPAEGVELVRALTEIRWRRLGTWIR